MAEYGLHVLETPAGTFSFVGTVPAILFPGSWKTITGALLAAEDAGFGEMVCGLDGCACRNLFTKN